MMPDSLIHCATMDKVTVLNSCSEGNQSHLSFCAFSSPTTRYSQEKKGRAGITIIWQNKLYSWLFSLFTKEKSKCCAGKL